MATIKDVARLAGVSHGTVSNVVNGTKTVNSDIVKRVQRAIKELGYQPNAKARSLRSSKTNLIGVILPGVSDSVYHNLYEGISHALRGSGYTLQLFLTDDKVDRERDALRSLQEQRAEGILLVSCMPSANKMFETVTASGARLLFLRRLPEVDCAFVGLDEATLLKYAMVDLTNAGHRSFLLITDRRTYSNEMEIAAAFDRFVALHAEDGVTGRSRCCGFGKSDVFRVCAAQLSAGEVPDVILTTGSGFLEMARRAAALFCETGQKQPEILCFQDYCFSKGCTREAGVLFYHNFYDTGARAAERLHSLLLDEDLCEGMHETMDAVKKYSRFLVPQKKCDLPLRLCLLEGTAADAARIMARRYTALTGKIVEIEACSYKELNQRMTMLDLMRDFDIVQTNRPWLNDCALSGFILPLDAYFSVAELEYSSEILNAFSFVDRRLFGVPFMMGAQLLFFRKDIFNNLRYQRLYYERFQQELRPPRTWQEFDRVAAFFTKSQNPDSPVDYGTALGAASTYSVYSYIPRLWELQGDVYDTGGNVVLDSREAVLALQRLREALVCCAPAALRTDWPGQVQSFFNGEVAMVNVYESHLMDGQRYSDPRIVGKFDVAPMPGIASIRGGWLLTISARTRQADDAADFLRWFSSAENVVSYNMLGGSNPGSAMLDAPELISEYPWFALACKTLAHARPMLRDNAPIQQATFERIAGMQIESCLLGQTPAEEAIRNIACQIAMISPKSQ